MLKKIRISIGGITQDFILESQTEELAPGAENKHLKELLKNIEKHTTESDTWECEVYKGHNCRYSFEDIYNDNCIFCGEPEERK